MALKLNVSSQRANFLASEVISTLTPHQYPAWIWFMGLGLIMTITLAIVQLPPYYRAATQLKYAEALTRNGQDRAAIDYFIMALHDAPSSNRIRIDLALSYFKSPYEEDRISGVKILQNVTLDKDDWGKVSAVMPKKYQSFFNDVKD